MSRSTKKTPIFGHCGKSEKKDKQLVNRMLRRLTKIKIITEKFEELPYCLDEVFNVWAMSKDGKYYWKEGETEEGGKYMRK